MISRPGKLSLSGPLKERCAETNADEIERNLYLKARLLERNVPR